MSAADPGVPFAWPRAAPWQRSARDRLLAAFGVLNAHGIVALGACSTDPDAARAALALSIRQRNPAAAGSYVFWTSSDEDCFADDGSLRGTLTLFASGPAVTRAVLAALAQHGLCAVTGSEGSVGVLPVAADEPSLN